MPASSLVAFWGVALLLIIAPGADWAFTVSVGLRGRSVALAVAGLVIGYTAVTGVVAVGVGALVAQRPAVLATLVVLGGGFLIWIGAQTFRSPAEPMQSPVGADRAAAGPGRWATVGRGIGVSGLNPKGLMIFIGLLPQFASPERQWPLAAQLAALGLVFVVTVAAFYLALGAMARTVLRSRPVAGRVVSRLSGAGMVLIGAWLIIDHLI